MGKDRIMCCVRSKVWLPDEFLTTIVGDCDRGKFRVTRPFTFPCMLLSNGNLYIEEQQGLEIPRANVDVSQIRCGSCGSEIEVREIEIRDILDKLRQREISMKEKVRESYKITNRVDKSPATPDLSGGP